MYFLKNRTTGEKTGFQDPGHQNWHKSCQNGIKPYCKGIKLINIKTGIKLQTVEIRRGQQRCREIHIIKTWISKNLTIGTKSVAISKKAVASRSME